jgi:carbonic anhydrase/acetyltransferase-like protein (isoleucine patch superfamily)
MSQAQPSTLNLDLTRPHIHPACFVAPNAIVIGNVTLGAESSIWYQCVLRGDVSTITIGERTNIQDGTIIHADPGFPTIIGNDVTVGHGAIVHGAVVEDGCLIGIRSTLLNGCKIGKGSVIGAGALVPEGMIVPPHSLVMGVPGKVVREVPERLAERSKRGAAGYVRFSQAHKQAWPQSLKG